MKGTQITKEDLMKTVRGIGSSEVIPLHNFIDSVETPYNLSDKEKRQLSILLNENHTLTKLNSIIERPHEYGVTMVEYCKILVQYINSALEG